MEGLNVDIAGWDFIVTSVYFVLAILVFFASGRGRRKWLSIFLLVVFCAHTVVTLVSTKTATTKVFTALLLVSLVTVEAVIVSREQRRVERQ